VPLRMIFSGDVNLLGLADPGVPFMHFEQAFKAADVVFCNLECCLYDPPGGGADDDEAFNAPAVAGGEALKRAGVDVVGIANNVNYGADSIKGSIARLDELGILHTGAGADAGAASKPAIVERNGTRIGFLQRTSVFWPEGHEAGAKAAGVAVVRGLTEFMPPPLHSTRKGVPPGNRPGVPPVIVTRADPKSLRVLKNDLAALRKQADIVVASFHWGVFGEVLEYMVDLAHAAIDSGADIVIGHGPHHYTMPIEFYKGKPIYYGLGAFSFQTGHGGDYHGDWVGMLAQATFTGRDVEEAGFRLVRQKRSMEIIPCALKDEAAVLDELRAQCMALGTQLKLQGDEVIVRPA